MKNEEEEHLSVGGGNSKFEIRNSRFIPSNRGAAPPHPKKRVRLLACVQLNIAAVEIDCSGVTVREIDLEPIVAARFAEVVNFDRVPVPALSIDLAIAFDAPASRTQNDVVGHACPLHLHARSMIDEDQMTPVPAVLDSTRDSKRSFSARRTDPATAGDEVLVGWTLLSGASDVRVGARNSHV